MFAKEEWDFQELRRKLLPLAGSLLCAILFVGLFAWITEEVFEGEMKQFDLQVRALVHEHSTQSGTSVMQSFSWLASPGVLLVLTILAVGTLWLTKRRRPAAWIVIALVGGVILNLVLKELFQRQRPDSFFGPNLSSYSFPSGHAMGSFCFYGVIAGLIAARVESAALRVLIWTAAGLLILGIGLSRIYLGVHYPTDVIAGYLAAAVWTSALLFLDRIREAKKPNHSPGAGLDQD